MLTVERHLSRTAWDPARPRGGTAAERRRGASRCRRCSTMPSYDQGRPRVSSTSTASMRASSSRGVVTEKRCGHLVCPLMALRRRATDQGDRTRVDAEAWLVEATSVRPSCNQELARNVIERAYAAVMRRFDTNSEPRVAGLATLVQCRERWIPVGILELAIFYVARPRQPHVPLGLGEPKLRTTLSD